MFEIFVQRTLQITVLCPPELRGPHQLLHVGGVLQKWMLMVRSAFR